MEGLANGSHGLHIEVRSCPDAHMTGCQYCRLNWCALDHHSDVRDTHFAPQALRKAARGRQLLGMDAKQWTWIVLHAVLFTLLCKTDTYLSGRLLGEAAGLWPPHLEPFA
jgi:hypothetical protein